MKRGMVQLNNSQMKILLEALKTSQSVDQLLMNKMLSNHHDQQQVNLELSEDEAETLIDCLPMPNPNDNQELLGLRQNLLGFLNKLRFPPESQVQS